MFRKIVVYLFCLFFATSTLADTITEEEKFIIEAKYGILPFIAYYGNKYTIRHG